MLQKKLNKEHSLIQREMSDNVYGLYKEIHTEFTPSQKLLFFILEVRKINTRSLARKMNVSHSAMMNLLLGKTKNPQMKTFNKIFKVYCQVYDEYILIR